MKNMLLKKLLSNLIRHRYIYYVCTACVILIIIGVLSRISISSIIAIIALVFSFLAYMHNKEQLRLSLFEKRLEVYINLLNFFKFINSKGDLYSQRMTREEDEKLLGFSQQSFLWSGFHKSTFLFGEDVTALFKEIEELYIFLLITDPSGDNAQDYYNKFHQLRNLDKKLPIIFRPYLYFGDKKMNI